MEWLLSSPSQSLVRSILVNTARLFFSLNVCGFRQNVFLSSFVLNSIMRAWPKMGDCLHRCSQRSWTLKTTVVSLCSQRSNAKRYVTSGISEPLSLNQLQKFMCTKFVWKRCITCPGKPNFTPIKLVHDSYFILNTYTTFKSVSFEKRR